MFDTMTGRFTSLEGLTYSDPEEAKRRDRLLINYYRDNVRVGNEGHIFTCNNCHAVADMYDAAYAEQLTRGLQAVNPTAPWEDELLQSVDTAEVARQDAEAALRQAEILGASADQRHKLRTIVEERLAAQHEAAELRQQLAQRTIERDNAQFVVTDLNNRLRQPIEDPSDERLWGIFGRAAVEANDQGYCSVYDQISQAVGIPDRATLLNQGYMPGRSYDVETEVTFRVTVTVEAANADNAIEEVDGMNERDLWEYIDGSLAWESMTNHDAREAERVDE